MFLHYEFLLYIYLLEVRKKIKKSIKLRKLKKITKKTEQ
jgi:hypothetical protein